LFEQGILHRIAKYKTNTVIDIPRHGALLLFLNKSDGFDELSLHRLEEIATDIVVICPPRKKSKIKEALVRYGKRTNAELGELRIYVMVLTFSEMQRLAKCIKENQLPTIVREGFCLQKDLTPSREGSEHIECENIGQVVTSWRRIEWAFRDALRRRSRNTSYLERPKYIALLQTLGLSRLISEFEWLRKTRNEILHNGRYVSQAFVQGYCRRARDLLAVIVQTLEEKPISNPPTTR
jgi:hypothetical protein